MHTQTQAITVSPDLFSYPLMAEKSFFLFNIQHNNFISLRICLVYVGRVPLRNGSLSLYMVPVVLSV